MGPTFKGSRDSNHGKNAMALGMLRYPSPDKTTQAA